MVSVALQSKDHRLAPRVWADMLTCQRSSSGDQSAGKSSVLEAISGMSFPIKDNLCTRFATELVLRRDAAPGVKISIIAGADRSPDKKVQLSGSKPEFAPVVSGMGTPEVRIWLSYHPPAPKCQMQSN